MRYKKSALYGLLIALAFVLSYLESLFPPLFAVPGIKLGLTNIVVIFAIYQMDVKSALIINFVRIILSGLLFGTVLSFMFSLAGGMLSTVIMLVLQKKTSLKIITVSIVGGLFHNIGQLIVAAFVLNTYSIAWYFVILWFSGIAAGAVIGLLSGIVINRCLAIIKNDH